MRLVSTLFILLDQICTFPKLRANFVLALRLIPVDNKTSRAFFGRTGFPWVGVQKSSRFAHQSRLTSEGRGGVVGEKREDIAGDA